MSYKEFIQNILDTRGRFACGDEYHERHHIIPKCMGGTNDEENLIDLFAREHFEAHKLLALENPNNNGLVYAWGCMAFVKKKNTNRYEVVAEEYEEARIALSNSLKGKYFGGNMPGRRKSEEHKKKLSIANKGKHDMNGCKNPHYGKTMSDESKQKMSLNRSNNYGINNHMYGKRHSECTKEKISKSNKGKFSGKNNPSYGKKPEEQKKQIAQYTRNGILISTYESMGSAERLLGISHAHISDCCNGKRKTAGGYHWEFVNKEEAI